MKADCVVIGKDYFLQMLERERMLRDIALSAVCLKLNIEHGFTPTLDALNRDLGAFQSRFGKVEIPNTGDGNNGGHGSDPGR